MGQAEEIWSGDLAAQTVCERKTLPAEQRPGGNGPHHPPGTVLFVSTDDEFRRTMRAYLEHVGCEVRCGMDAARIQELFFGGKGADLLLIDLDRLGTSGPGIASQLEGRGPHVPVIILSAPGMPRLNFPGARRRGWRFLSKPVVLPRLLDLVRNALEHQQSGRKQARRAGPEVRMEALAGPTPEAGDSPCRRPNMRQCIPQIPNGPGTAQ